MMLKISLFPNMRQPAGREVETEWEAFAKTYLCKHRSRPFKDGELYSAAVYREGHVQRADENVIGITAVIIDFDNSEGKGNDAKCVTSPTLPEDHATNLDGLTYAWHSTYTNNKDWPRWRLVIPLDRMATPQEWRGVFSGVIALLGGDGNIDMTCGELSRAYWAPAAPPKTIQDAFSGYQEGEPAKVGELLSLADDQSKIVPLFTPSPIAHVPTAQPSTKYDGRNDALKAQVAACLDKGKSLDETAHELIQYDSAHHNPPLFTDRSENMRADPYSNAVRFIANNLQSINSRRLTQGLDPQTFAATPAQTPAGAFAFTLADHITHALKPPDYLVKPYIERDAVHVLFGDSDTLKSFIAIDLGCHVAGGVAYYGHRCKQGAVFYLCGEGRGGIARRLAAWKIAKGRDHIGPFFVSEIPAQLIDARNAQAIRAQIEAHSTAAKYPPALIIIDTLATNLGDGDENHTKDINAFLGNIVRELRQPFQAAILLVHHVGHGEKGRERGAYAIRGNADARIHVERSEHADVILMHSVKAKDGEKWPAVGFVWEQVKLGITDPEDGEEYTSLAVHMTTDLPVEANGAGRAKKATKGVGKAQAAAVNVLLDMVQEQAENKRAGGFDDGLLPLVLITDWRDACFDQNIFKSRQHFNQVRESLIEKGLIRLNGIHVAPEKAIWG